MQDASIRKSVFDGKFYPHDSGELAELVRGYIDSAKIDFRECDLKALVFPHAGYIYSGTTAGYSAKALKMFSTKKFLRAESKIKIFLLGLSHNIKVTGLGLSTVDFWETPLGKVKVSALCSEMIRKEEICVEADRTHSVEHSIEVVIPFLQIALSELKPAQKFEIIPIIVSDIDFKSAAVILEKYISANDLVIVSTDLSHYLEYSSALDIDNNTVDQILRLDIGGFGKTGDACGKESVLILMSLARKLGWVPILADYSNSGDTAGDKKAVVGYASIIFCSAQNGSVK
ncbi:MAG: AmmeMemoRadiSam system protein B [Patescibacteria group bacterium]|nr:AmmeMemoRadiSam system protein B [Patescibacteria group bacterium]